MYDLGIDPEEYIAAFCASRYVRELEKRNSTFLCGMAGSELCRLILTEAGITEAYPASTEMAGADTTGAGTTGADTTGAGTTGEAQAGAGTMGAAGEIDSKTNKPRDRRAKFWWAGDVIAYYQYYRNVSFRYIFSFVSITEILRMFTVYHEMNITQFMDRMDTLAKQAPSRLAQMRKKRQLSQSELAKASGVPVKTIQAYEQKRKDINRAEAVTVLKLADTLSCTTRDILEI